MEMDAAERATKLDSMKGALKKAEDDHNELLKQLQAQFKESQDGLEKLKEDSAPVIKMLKAATPSGNAAGGKDESKLLSGPTPKFKWASCRATCAAAPPFRKGGARTCVAAHCSRPGILGGRQSLAQ